MTGICAIHQPNFFPWLGYFDKMRRSDVFVYLDDVDYPRSGSGGMASWSSRVKVNVQGNEKWIGCNLQRYSGIKAIRDVQISDDHPWRKKMLRTLEMNYKKSPNFRDAMDVLTPLVLNPTVNLADFNILVIEKMREVLGIDVKTIRQSELNVAGKATELLINITCNVGCDTYLCGGGTTGYQEDELFKDAGLKLEYQNFAPQPYGEQTSFIPGLSVIDYIMKGDVFSKTQERSIDFGCLNKTITF